MGVGSLALCSPSIGGCLCPLTVYLVLTVYTISCYMLLRSGKKAELCVRAPRKQRTVNKASDRSSSRPEGLKETPLCPERTETMEK